MSDSEADIAALRAENEALRRRVADLESVAARSQVLYSMWEDVLMVLDKDGRLLYLAPTQSPLLSAPKARDNVGKRLHEFLPPPAADHFVAVIGQTLVARKITKLEYTLPIVDKTGWFLGTVAPLSDTTVLWIAHDITNQRRLVEVEEDLRAFRVLAENAPDGISMAGEDGAYFYANPAYRRMTGYGEAILGRSVFDIIADPEEVTAELAAEVQKNGRWEGAATLTMASGEVLPCHIAVMLLPRADGQQTIIAAIVRDLTPQRKAEAERLSLQAQVIEAQRAALRELSTPLVPLADGVIAMPLIGAIDRARASEVMEKLLTGITTLRARTAILDVTGVKVVDAVVADALLKVARAARLLGAHVILTGIGPEVARSLVELGVDLGGIVTLGTLQSGITYALRQR